MIIASSRQTKKLKKGLCDAPIVSGSKNNNAAKELNRIKSAFGRTINYQSTNDFESTDSKFKKDTKK